MHGEFQVVEPECKYARLSTTDACDTDGNDNMGEDGAAPRDSSQRPGSDVDTHGDDNKSTSGDEGCSDTMDFEHSPPYCPEWHEVSVPDDIFGNGKAEDNPRNYDGMSACPARDSNDDTVPDVSDDVTCTPMDTSNSGDGYTSACADRPPPLKVRRTALLTKTTPGEAYNRGHLDASPATVQSTDTATANSDDEDELNLELELEKILDAEGTPDFPDLPNAPVDTHGGYLLQINDIVWCFHCGASASLGNTSLYLRKPCKGKPPNLSMSRRRRRLIKRQHPTTCEHLNGTHKRVRII